MDKKNTHFIDHRIENFLLKAESKALATLSLDGIINVVPVSTITIKDGKIILVNYFMEKTFENIISNKNMSLVAWTKMMGYQIKGTIEYITEGDVFDEVVVWVKEILPDRLVKGIIAITPVEVFDIAPTKNSYQQL